MPALDEKQSHDSTQVADLSDTEDKKSGRYPYENSLQNELTKELQEPSLREHSVNEDGTSVASANEKNQQEHLEEKDSAHPDDDDEDDVERNAGSTPSEPLHSVFSKRKRVFIIVMAAIASFFSPFSANIYFPALNPIAADLHVSSSTITLSLTTYMIFQGLAPTVLGNLADTSGRRPIYILCFVVYIAACIGIALQDSFAALLILRCVQSSGSSSTISLASGVAGDVATSAERGVFMGWITSGALAGPAAGPILGGLLAQYLGWRAIFWFLAILGGVFLVPLVLAFPETSRNVVGNGSIPPRGWNRTLWDRMNEYRRKRHTKGTASDLSRQESKQSIRSARAKLKHKRRLPSPLATLRVLLEKDVLLLLLYNSFVYVAFYDITASIPYIFQQTYNFNELQIGLSYLPIGIGTFLAPLINGRLLDWNFRRIARQVGMRVEKGRTNDLRNFPLERARVWIALPLVLLGDVCIVGYGWAMEYNAPLAVPLVLTFFVGLFLSGSFNVMSVMLVDYYPNSPSTATAANNLVRCLLGAAGTAIIVYMIDAMGRGWCFTFIALVVLLFSGSLLVLLRWGAGWREARRVRLSEQDQ